MMLIPGCKHWVATSTREACGDVWMGVGNWMCSANGDTWSPRIELERAREKKQNVPATWARKVIDDMVWSYHMGTAPQCSDTMSGHSCD